MRFIQNDEYVRPLSKEQKETAKRAYEHFSGYGDIFVFETIHGHSIQINRLEGWERNERHKNAPLKMYNDDIRFLSSLNIRFIEGKLLTVNIGV